MKRFASQDRQQHDRAPILPGSLLDELIVIVLGDADVPLGAYAIVDRLRERCRLGNVAAVYRSLDRLSNRMLIERVESLSAYRLNTASQAVLMVCSGCRATKPLLIHPEFQSIEGAVRINGFKLDKLVVEAIGVCESCRKKSQGSSVNSPARKP